MDTIRDVMNRASVRCANIINETGAQTVDELRSIVESGRINKFRNCGKKTIAEIRSLLGLAIDKSSESEITRTQFWSQVEAFIASEIKRRGGLSPNQAYIVDLERRNRDSRHLSVLLIWMKDKLRMPTHEIAKVLGLSVPVISQRIKVARWAHAPVKTDS